MDVTRLLALANDQPGADDLSPGGLGQLIAGVAYAYAGRPIRQGMPHPIEARIAALADRLGVTVDEEGV